MSRSDRMDRQGARTASDLEYKYQFGKAFAEVMGVATDARSAADEAKEAASRVDENLTSEELFNRLTNGGEDQGIYREGDKIFINASYIKSGELIADLIKTGVIKSIDGESIVINLDSGTATLTGSLKTVLATDEDGEKVYAEITPAGIIVTSPNRTITIDKYGVQMEYKDEGAFIDFQADLSAQAGQASLILRDLARRKFLDLQISSIGTLIQLNGGKITGVNAPSADTDAANKAYVDEQIAALKAQLT